LKDVIQLPAVCNILTAHQFTIFYMSVDVHAGLTARDLNSLPKSPNTVRTLITQYANKVHQVGLGGE